MTDSRNHGGESFYEVFRVHRTVHHYLQGITILNNNLKLELKTGVYWSLFWTEAISRCYRYIHDVYYFYSLYLVSPTTYLKKKIARLFVTFVDDNIVALKKSQRNEKMFKCIGNTN